MKKRRQSKGASAQGQLPPTRRTFVSTWDEISYLYHKLLYWLYGRGKEVSARRFGGRLKKLLEHADPAHHAILGEECWSLVCEAEGDLVRAIQFREHEIHLMTRALKLAGPNRRELPAGYPDYDDLLDRFVLLAMLHNKIGDTSTAIHRLRRAQRFAVAHGLPFNAGDLLSDYRIQQREDKSR